MTALPRLYLLRFGFAAVWAALIATMSSSLGAFTVALLVLYPAFDVAAVAWDARSGRAGSRPALLANVAVSALAAVGLGIAGAHDIPAVVRVWGAWAAASGLVQLTLGLSRRQLGGQHAIIASGAISAVVGVAMLGMASSATSVGQLAGYAAAGGVFFLVSALRLRRVAAA